MDIDLLRTFVAICDTGSFTAAARHVGRTQSAVSLQVRRLEQSLGRPLFQRGAHGTELTEHGALLGIGLGIGLIAALVAVLPSLLSPTAAIPYGSLLLTLAAVLLNGALWTWLATRYAVRGDLLKALRNE